MSRSRRRTPYLPYAAPRAGEEKLAKRRAHRALRARIRSRQWGDVPPALREVSNVYLFPKDGKRYVPNPTPSISTGLARHRN